MISKCLILLFLFVLIEAQYYSYKSCRVPHLKNGRVRARQRSKMVKFLCAARYELVGNRYATCRNGEWDVPMPVCVRPGCMPFSVDNAVHIRAHHDAWVVTLCMPSYRLVGSSALYCDGQHWNGTVPACVDTSLTPALSCDFESADLCGWMQDELHDFDWKRINTKTPSYFMETGPSYDHTLGEGGDGHFMYIESTSKLQNHTARLLSPIYNSSLALNGCFSFFFHMYGAGTGGLRVYQKPDSVQMEDLLKLSDSAKEQYLLWEKWGDQGNYWYSAAPDLKDFRDNFQIVVEGIRGRSFTSDIAIDDVSLQQGGNCSKFLQENTTPLPPGSEWSCENRCGVSPDKAPSDARCDCHSDCYKTGRCCLDYAELCIFSLVSSIASDDYDSATVPEPPQTQKLVGEITTTTSSTPQPTSTTTTPKPTTTTTPKPTTKTTPTNPSTTKPPTTKTTTKPTIAVVTKTTKRWTTARTTAKTTTTKQPTTTTPSTQKTTRKPTYTTKTTVKPTKTMSTLKTTIMYVTAAPKADDDDVYNGNISVIETEEAKKSEKENDLQDIGDKPVEKKSSTMKTAVITIVCLGLFAGLIYLVLVSRTARGQQALSWLRGHGGSDTSEAHMSAVEHILGYGGAQPSIPRYHIDRHTRPPVPGHPVLPG